MHMYECMDNEIKEWSNTSTRSILSNYKQLHRQRLIKPYMSLHKVNPTGFVFFQNSPNSNYAFLNYKSILSSTIKITCKNCQTTHFIVLSYRAWKYKANKPSFTFTTVQIRDQKTGVSGNIPGVSGTTFSGVSGHLLGVSGLPNPEFPGLYPEFPPECSKPGVSGPDSIFRPKN